MVSSSGTGHSGAGSCPTLLGRGGGGAARQRRSASWRLLHRSPRSHSFSLPLFHARGQARAATGEPLHPIVDDAPHADGARPRWWRGSGDDLGQGQPPTSTTRRQRRCRGLLPLRCGACTPRGRSRRAASVTAAAGPVADPGDPLGDRVRDAAAAEQGADRFRAVCHVAQDVIEPYTGTARPGPGHCAARSIRSNDQR